MKKYELYVLSFPNNKIYIGISLNSKTRLLQHKSQALNGSKLPVHHAVRKYGADNVVRSVKCIGPRDYIADLEIKMISMLRTQDRLYGYNVTDGGDISPMHSESVRAKVSATKQRIGFSEKQRAALARNIGRKASAETRERLRISHLGQKMPEEQRLKMIGRPAANKDVPATQESKEKNRVAALARWADPEKRERYLSVVRDDGRRKKTAESTRNQWADPETRAAIHAGIVKSKAKRIIACSAGQKAAWSNPEKREERLRKLRATNAAKKKGIDKGDGPR